MLIKLRQCRQGQGQVGKNGLNWIDANQWLLLIKAGLNWIILIKAG